MSKKEVYDSDIPTKDIPIIPLPNGDQMREAIRKDFEELNSRPPQPGRKMLPEER